MYRINTVGRPVLITVSEILAKAAVDQNTDIRLLTNSIEIAEERYVAPSIGDVLYEDMVRQKNVVVTADNKAELQALINASRTAARKSPIEDDVLVPGMIVNAMELMSDEYQQLWNRYLWRITAEAVDISGIVPSWLRTTAQGQQVNAPQTIGGITEGSASGERKDIQYKIEGMVQHRLEPMIARMKKWLCDHLSWYPQYDNCGCKQADGISNYKGGIVLGIYDDDAPPVHKGTRIVGAAPKRTQECIMKLEVWQEPNPDVPYMLCNLKPIQKQYPEGDTLTIPHLAGKYILWPIWIDSAPYTEMPYDNNGTFDNSANGGFYAPSADKPLKVMIKYVEKL